MSEMFNSQVFWFGDLNYRLNMADSEVRKLVAQKRWDELKNSDQVRFLIMFSFDSTLLSLFSSIRLLLTQIFNLI